MVIRHGDVVQIDQMLHGRYRLLNELGTGGMSVVWRARDDVLDRDVAVKVLAGFYADAGARAHLRAEARTTAKLKHPNVTDIYDYGEASGVSGITPYVVMELLRGQTLSQRLRLGPLAPPEGLRVCAEVAAALAAAHAAGLVHRDVKPSNVMLTDTGAKVFDFGIAAAIGSGELDGNGELLGTPAYLAPERLTAGEVVPASDVYALGLLMHRVFTTKLPWPGETVTQMVRAHVYATPAALPLMAGLPASINTLCDRCLSKDPQNRPTAAEVAAALNASADGGPLSNDATEATGSSHRRRLIAGGATLAAMVALAAPLTRQDQPAGEGARTPPLSYGSSAPAANGAEQRQPSPATGMPAPGNSAATRAPALTTTRPRTRPPTQGTTRAPAAPNAVAPTTSAVPTAAGTPVRARGGTVSVRCSGTTTTVLAVDPAPGYTIKDHDAGPADEIQVVLLSAANESEIKVKCGNDGPLPAIKESAQ
jgi:serine/threonine-protein kinase